MMAGMAIVMIVGMIVSTIVTLFFTPVYYSLLDDLAHIGFALQAQKSAKGAA